MMCQQLELELSLCHRNLILLLSSLRFLEGRCNSSPGDWSAYQSAFSYKRFQCDFPSNSMSTCSFHLCFSSLLRWIFSFLFSFSIHPRISSNQSLIFGWFDGAHHHQLVLFLCERFHEIYKARHLLGLSCEFCGIEGQNKD